MNQGVLGQLTVCILDYNRPIEVERCVRSIHQHVLVDKLNVLYVSNGGDQTCARRLYDEGLVDTLVLNRVNVGCGIGMRLAAQSAMTEWIMMVQCDQYAIRPYVQAELDHHIGHLSSFTTDLYIDLAGNQGGGRASERAHLIHRRRYLDLPGMDDVIGGPGPYAQYKWTEKHIQDQGCSFAVAPLLFADNGAWSEREYGPEYGGAKTRHRTDTKRLWILSPFSRRADGFPNLNLTNEEWIEVLEGRWPVEGKIPELDLPHSFKAWPE